MGEWEFSSTSQVKRNIQLQFQLNANVMETKLNKKTFWRELHLQVKMKSMHLYNSVHSRKKQKRILSICKTNYIWRRRRLEMPRLRNVNFRHS